jgi:acyl carrier protein
MCDKTVIFKLGRTLMSTEKKQAIIDGIQSFIHLNFPQARKKGLKNSDDLLNTGIIDSLGLLTIITHIEEQYGFRVEDDEVQDDNFNSIDTIVAYIETKLSV